MMSLAEDRQMSVHFSDLFEEKCRPQAAGFVYAELRKHLKYSAATWYLMRLVPAILISCPQRCSVVQQGLAAGSVAPYQYSVVQRSQATAVLVVWGCSE